MFIGGKKNNRKRLSAREYFSNADTSHLTDEELQELNDEKDTMIWFKIYNCYQHYFLFEQTFN